MTDSNLVKDTADLVKGLHEPTVINVKTEEGITAEFLCVPKDMAVNSLNKEIDAKRTHPKRRSGRALFSDIDSFIAHTNRFKDKNSVLFANKNKASPSIASVLDYHESRVANEDAIARFGEHQGLFLFPLSDEWKFWINNNNFQMNQIDFAGFIENRIADFTLPAEDAEASHLQTALGGTYASPNKLVELSRGLAVNEGNTVKQAVNLSSGETTVQYVTEHTNEAGQPIKVPNLFMVAIPVFEGGDYYTLEARLRYRLRSGQISWFYELYRPENAITTAIEEICDKAADKTELPLFYGTPES